MSTVGSDVTLIVIAKETIAGKVKTRLTPQLSFESAAMLAAASIQDTFTTVRGLPFKEKILLFDGDLLPPNCDDFRVLKQVSGGLDERIAAALKSLSSPVLLIGMDTPQVSADLLAPVFSEWSEDVDAWFGFAEDGGFWALGLSKPDSDLVRGVPMSEDSTGQEQLKRLAEAGLAVKLLPMLNDVDTFEDAVQVASLIPDSAFARTLVSLKINA